MEERAKKRFKADFTGDDSLNLLSDGKLLTEDGCDFHIHKYVLAKNNSYFRALFCRMGKDRNEFLIPGLRGEILCDILFYIYSGKIHITNENNISELMIASDYLMEDNILAELKIFIKNNLSIHNCISSLVGSLTINKEDFINESYRFVQTNFERVVQNESTEIADLPLEVFETFLSDRSLCIRNEMTAFISIVQWVSSSSERLAFVPNLIKYLMLSAIDEDSATEILQHDIAEKTHIFKI